MERVYIRAATNPPPCRRVGQQSGQGVLVRARLCPPASADREQLAGSRRSWNRKTSCRSLSRPSARLLLPISPPTFLLCHLPTHFLKEMPPPGESRGGVTDAVWRWAVCGNGEGPPVTERPGGAPGRTRVAVGS